MSKNVFLTIVLGSQVDPNFIQVISQISRILQFEITQKKFHQKHFTITKPLFYLELRGKIVRLPAKLCQTGQSSRKSEFWALFYKFRRSWGFDYWNSQNNKTAVVKTRELLCISNWQNACPILHWTWAILTSAVSGGVSAIGNACPCLQLAKHKKKSRENTKIS